MKALKFYLLFTLISLFTLNVHAEKMQKDDNSKVENLVKSLGLESCYAGVMGVQIIKKLTFNKDEIKQIDAYCKKHSEKLVN